MFDVSSVCATTMTSSSLKSLLLSSAWVQKMLYNMLTLYCPGVGSRPGLDHERLSCPVVGCWICLGSSLDERFSFYIHIYPLYAVYFF